MKSNRNGLKRTWIERFLLYRTALVWFKYVKKWGSCRPLIKGLFFPLKPHVNGFNYAQRSSRIETVLKDLTHICSAAIDWYAFQLDAPENEGDNRHQSSRLRSVFFARPNGLFFSSAANSGTRNTKERETSPWRCLCSRCPGRRPADDATCTFARNCSLRRNVPFSAS